MILQNQTSISRSRSGSLGFPLEWSGMAENFRNSIDWNKNSQSLGSAQLHVPNARRIRNLGKSEWKKFSQSNWIFVHNERKSSKLFSFFLGEQEWFHDFSFWDTSISATTNSSQASTMNDSPQKYSNKRSFRDFKCRGITVSLVWNKWFPALSIFPFHLRFGKNMHHHLASWLKN